MRVIAGKARRHNLVSPEGKDVRPTLDRTKETLFNMINMNVIDSNFLDLFSGSGAIGIEALSRGGKNVVFVENSTKALDCIKKNLEHTKLEEDAIIFNKDVVYAIETFSREDKKFDVIFMDPPYNKGWEEKVITLISDSELLNRDGILICESSKETDFKFISETKFEIIKEKTFKTSKFTFMEWNIVININ